jgi:hypothetical protein
MRARRGPVLFDGGLHAQALLEHGLDDLGLVPHPELFVGLVPLALVYEDDPLEAGEMQVQHRLADVRSDRPAEVLPHALQVDPGALHAVEHHLVRVAPVEVRGLDPERALGR